MTLSERHPSLPYVVPFAVFLAALAIFPKLGLPDRVEFTLRIALLITVLIVFSRKVISFRVVAPVSTVVFGVAICALWVAPDLLVPGWREHWLFQNAIFGKITSSLSESAKSDPVVLVIRSFRAIVLVAIIEELFWRAWLLRWLINPDFQKVELGRYSAQSFWITAILFASEHGPYWDVGLLCGMAYNWWMYRTKSLGDLILAHAVTNACLCGFVLYTGRWEYWL
ncbi:MAG TPA: CAAX prenyl protease-related protein [Solibacterales bacterium]|nr:CAAX prenyl protease-related protein [Bryobacterales bacterium]